MPELSLVFYGKGGIGKTTIATHMSVAFAEASRRVLHLGCDPKMDSTLRLVSREEVPTVVDFIEDRSLGRRTPEDLIVKGRWGIDTIETGGPAPGVGCAGRGVATLIDFLALHGVESWPYDVAVYDVLGDLVCGGFVAPLRYGMESRVVIVASGELMALYAANNIANVVLNHADDGVRLSGIIYNVKVLDAGVKSALDRFSERIGARTLGYIPWDPLVKEAERLGQTVFEHAPDSESSARLRALAARLLEGLPADHPLPRPMARKEFLRFGRDLEL